MALDKVSPDFAVPLLEIEFAHFANKMAVSLLGASFSKSGQGGVTFPQPVQAIKHSPFGELIFVVVIQRRLLNSLSRVSVADCVGRAPQQRPVIGKLVPNFAFKPAPSRQPSTTICRIKSKKIA